MNASTVVEAPTERCPWCDSEILRSKFLQIQTKIVDQERKKIAEERARIEARIMEEATNKVAAIVAERDQATSELKEIAAREATVRQQAVVEAETRIRAEAAKTLAAVTADRDQTASELKE